MDRNKAYRYFHALLGELGIRDRKADILSGYGVESAADLTDGQLTQLIGALENEKHHRRAERETREADALRRHRSRVLRILTDMGVYYVEPGEPRGACWDRVNRFLSSPRIAGKKLYVMTPEELSELEGKLRAMMNKGYLYGRHTAAPRPAKEAAPVVVVVGSAIRGPVS